MYSWLLARGRDQEVKYYIETSSKYENSNILERVLREEGKCDTGIRRHIRKAKDMFLN